MLFTKRFTKDLLLICLFIGGLYLLIQSPLVSPKPIVNKGFWSIQLMQQPLVLGIAGHNYLVLRDDGGSIIRELHGLATDTETNEWKYVGNKTTDILQVWEFIDTKTYAVQKGRTGIVLYQGIKDEVLATWSLAYPCKNAINMKKINYPPFGVDMSGDTKNSNSVAYTLASCMGLPTKHIGLLTPGSTKNLLEN
jgi:hypothetical protein